MMLVKKSRNGFTLMELMIALGLLGALMAVAWSLLGTFRDAEMRGWKLSHRTQTIRSTRAWLENDIQHLTLAAAPQQSVVLPTSTSSTLQAGSVVFRGTAMGFTATISPSIDPIPFLSNLMTAEPDTQFESMSEQLSLGEGFAEASGPPSRWPSDSVEIEYELRPMVERSMASPSISDGQLDTTQYSLVRREQVISNSRPEAVPTERVLSVQDLYGQSDDANLTSELPKTEMRLDGLVRPQFRFFDGVAWVSQWNSSQRGGLPSAIAFGFDFPAAADILHPSERETDETVDEGSIPESELANDPQFDLLQSGVEEPMIESVSERDSGDNQWMMVSSTNEVQLVIFVAGGVAPSTAASNLSIPKGRP